FESAATNLVAGDTNGAPDIFVADRVTGTTTRVSVATKNLLGASAQANRASAHPAISADGRYVAFESKATNLVPADTNAVTDIFVADRVAATTIRMSVDGGGAESRGGDSRNPSIAVNATKVVVAFSSAATNLVAGDTNGVPDVFVRQVDTANLSAGTTTRINLGCTKALTQADVVRSTYFPTPAVSGDAKAVAFESDAANLVPADTNGVGDIFVFRLGVGCARVSVDNSFAQANGASYAPSLNYDATVVAFTSAATNLVAGDTNGVADIFVRNLATAVTTRASVAGPGTQAKGGSDHPSVSGDGRYVAFDSAASNLVSGDTGYLDVFVHDNSTGATGRTSIGAGGAAPNGDSVLPAISANGAVVVFASTAANLVTGDTNAAPDTFARQRG
ncbi:MAG: hypothetical protein LC708_03140, partial [Actinobacteria bacterium]|nr:hypothetical protein [Actinomycetota bacterium]